MLVSTELVEIRIPARAEWVAVARLSIAAVAHRMPFALEDIEDLKLAIAEACTTAIQEAQEGDAIEIACGVAPDALRLTVRHRHNAAISNRLASEPGSKDLGLILIKALMDEVSYSVEPDGESHLVMTKRVTS
jgi:serine/threonine-protein kinase RsbW